MQNSPREHQPHKQHINEGQFDDIQYNLEQEFEILDQSENILSTQIPEQEIGQKIP
jgi:hypothetical protein